MHLRRFGRTDLQMSVLSCGGMRYQQSWNAADTVSSASQRNLEQTIDRALAVGINHIETARGYGTSEAQLGPALARHDRSKLILQTKASPRPDPAEFERNLLESFARLRVSRIDLFGFHGINTPEYAEWTLRPGGCWEVADRLRREGRIGHIGFSTHGSCRLICDVVATGRFDYVNLHHYYILRDNDAAVTAARAQDMGVFIISPSDKGGRLWAPTETLQRLCDPLSPMVFNDLFCLADPRIHTISIGAARPSDFDEHLRVMPLLADAETHLAPIAARLEAAYRDAVGADFAARWQTGIPDWDALPGGVNVRFILWLFNLVKAYGVLPFAQERYSQLTGRDHWVPGSNAAAFSEAELVAALRGSPFAARIPALLREAHLALRAR